jgi:hypothetical protein
MEVPILSNIYNKLSGSDGNQRSQIPPEMMMPAPNIQFAPSSGADYPESFYRHQTDIRKVDSQDGMCTFIDEALLSHRCKDALKSLVANLYDDNIILSNHGVRIEAEIAYLKAKVYLRAFVKANSYKTDVLNPVWGLVIHHLYYQLELRFTRTVGMDRERIVQGKIVQQHEITQGYRPPNPALYSQGRQ